MRKSSLVLFLGTALVVLPVGIYILAKLDTEWAQEAMLDFTRITGDKQAELKWFSALAKNDNVDMQVSLGEAFRDGSTFAFFSRTMVSQNGPASVHWFEMAANLNHVKSKCDLGDIYRDGIPGVEKNPEKAFQFYESGAEFTEDPWHERCVRGLANMHLLGIGVERDFEKGLTILRDFGRTLPEALGDLGVSFLNAGEDQQALKWLSIAAEQGNTSVKSSLWLAESRLQKSEQRSSRNEVSPFAIFLGLIAYGIAVDAFNPSDRNWSDEQIKQAKQAEKKRQNSVNNHLDLGWALVGDTSGW